MKYLFAGTLLSACAFPLVCTGAESYAKMEFVRLPAGIFMMGEKKVLVRLSAFSLGKTEITQAQWKAVMRYNPSPLKGDNLPVEDVSWYEAMSFCQKLTEREHRAGRLPRNLKFTLPTEAQWEYACRAGTKTHFSFGDSSSLFSPYGNFADKSFFNTPEGKPYSYHPLATSEEKESNDGFGYIAPVGSFHSNAWGFYDMHGNVCEWCLDYFDSTLKGGKNPIRATPGNCEYGTQRIIRGGGWLAPTLMCSSTYRNSEPPESGYYSVGFRVAIVRNQD